ncbi:MAG: HU family DNA-binding protein [Myxococcota bacterium]
MTKTELLDAIAKARPELKKKDVSVLVESLFSSIAASVKKDGTFTFPGFGTFRLRKRKARDGRNPQTGETMKIKASKTIGFKPAKALKDRL